MARPIFVLLAHSTAQDPVSGLLSVVELVEKIAIRPLQKPKNKPGVLVLRDDTRRAVSVWMLEEHKGERYEDQYEHQFLIHLPGADEPIVTPSAPFVFGVTENGKLEKRPFHRFHMGIEGPLPFKGPGMMWLESRVRKVGTDEWQTQGYPVVLQAAAPDETSVPSEEAAMPQS